MRRSHFNWKPVIVLVFLLIVLSSTVFVLRQWQRGRLAYNSLKLGMEAYDEHAWGKAASNLGRYLVVNSDDIEILLKYADAQLKIRPLKNSNIQQAASTYRSVLRIDKNNRTAVETLVGLYLKLDIPAEAELVSRRYLETNQDPEIETMLAMSLGKQRKFKEASDKLKKVIEEHPDHILAYEIMGSLSQYHGENFSNLPEYWFSESVDKNPFSAAALIGRACYCLKNQQPGSALRDLELAEKLDLSDSYIHLRLANAFSNLNMFEKARKHLVSIWKQEPANPGLWQTWARLELKAMSKEHMVKVAQMGLKEMYPDVWDFMGYAAELFIKSGEFDLAGDCIAKLKKKEMSPVTTAFLEGLLAKSQLQDFKAVACWLRAQELGDKSEKIHLELAAVYSRLGDHQSAIQQLRKFVSLQPNSFSGHFHLAKLLTKIGSCSEAASHARLARQLAENNLDAHLLYIWTQIRLAQNSRLDANEQIWQSIGAQLDTLEKAAGQVPEVKLLQFRIAVYLGQYGLAEQLVTDLMGGKDISIEVGMAEVDLMVAQGKIDKAILHLYSLRKKFPDSVLPIRQLAVLLALQQKNEDCEKVLLNGLQAIYDPEAKRELTLQLADFYDYWGKQQSSYGLLSSLMRELPRDVLVKRRILKNSEVKNDVSYAQQIIDDIRSIEGDQGWQWRYEQARLWFESEAFTGRYTQIIILLKDNIAANPDNQLSRMLLASTYEKGGELQLSVATYREALDRSPQDLNVIVPAVGVMYRAKEYDQADEILNQAARRKLFSPRISKLNLQRYLREGKLDSAERLLEELRVNDPNNFTVSLSLALLKMREGKYDQAYELLDNLKAGGDEVMSVTSALVELKVRQEKDKEALALCDEMINQFGNSSAYILRGKAYLLLDRNDLAEKDFLQATVVEPESVQAWMAKSQFNRSIGRYEDAFNDIQKAIQLKPTDLYIQKHAIATLLASDADNKFSRCLEVIDKALAQHGQDVELQLYKARCILASGTALAMNQCVLILEKITQVQPEMPNGWALWAGIYLEQAQFGKAMDIVLRGLTYSPDDKDLLLLKARIEAVMAPALAVPTLKLLLEQEPNNIKLALELSKTYVAMGQCDKSVALLQDILSRCKEKNYREIKMALAVSLYRKGDKDQAEELFEQLYISEPDDSKLFQVEMNLLKDDDRWSAISHKVNRWIKNNPKDISPVTKLVENLVATKNEFAMDMAESLVRELLRANPESLEAMNSLAVLLQIRGRSSEAAKIYEQILKLKPDALIALNNLAWILCEEQGKYEQALKFTQNGLRKAPDYTDLVDTRGVIYYRMNEYDKAVQDFYRCLELYPRDSISSAISRFHLARSQIALGQDGIALENLRKIIDLNNKIGGMPSTEIAEARLLLAELLKEGESHGDK